MDASQHRQKADEKIVQVLKALGDVTRFRIYGLLRENDLCVGALAQILTVSRPAVSQHLKILREAGLITGEKRGYWTHYKVEGEALQESARQLQALSQPVSGGTGRGHFICLREQGSAADTEPGTERMTLPMCKSRCEQPERLQTRPAACTPEQIQACHGEGSEHSCQ